MLIETVIRSNFMSLSKTLNALNDSTRVQILNILKEAPLSAGEICNHFSITDAAISRHLSILKDADLVRARRSGKYIYYELNISILDETILWLKTLKGGSNEIS